MRRLAALVRPILHAKTLREASAALGWSGVILCGAPQGSVDRTAVHVRASTIPGAQLGVFATRRIGTGEIVGRYPGYLHPGSVWWITKGRTPAGDLACTYAWFLASGNVLDPTNEEGQLQDVLVGLGGLWRVPTVMSRINEPPSGTDTNIHAAEEGNTVSFTARVGIDAGDELFVYYGPNYDRACYQSDITVAARNEGAGHAGVRVGHRRES